MTPLEFLARLRSDKSYRGQIVHVEQLKARPARFAKPARPLNREFLDFFTQMEELFELVLERFEERYANVFDRVDLLLGSEPTVALAAELRQRLPANPVTRRRFFASASAAWIGP